VFFREGQLSVLITVPIVILAVLSSFSMIILILLHSGRGGGLSDMFGGGMGAAAAGSTVVERNLSRITVFLALVWSFSILTLSIRLA
jgi:preprotein translocase subunit SecG